MARIKGPSEGAAADRHGRRGRSARPETARLREVCKLLERRVERIYGVRVSCRRVCPPFKGDLDGERIWIDPSQTPEQRVFMIAHLFGHIVQWNVSGRNEKLDKATPPVSTELIRLVEMYERQAARFGLQLLYEVAAQDLRRWYSEYSDADTAYLKHYYLTGDIGVFEDFWRGTQVLLSPLSIPEFVPKRFIRRSAGVVI